MWKTCKLEDICLIGDGNHSSNYPKNSEMVDKGIPFIRAGNIHDGTITDIDLKFITPNKHKTLKKGHLKEGDVLLINRGEIGKTAIVPKKFENSNLNSQIAFLRPDEKLLSKFLYYSLNTRRAKNLLISKKTGAALNQLTIKRIKEFKISFPSLEEQNRIVLKVESAFKKINEAIGLIKIKIEKVANLKSLILSNMLINKNFEKFKFRDVAEYIKNSAQNSKLPYLGMENISSETMKIVGEVKVPESSSGTFEFNNTYVLFGRLRPYLKKVLLPSFRGQCSTEVFCIKPKQKVIREYIGYWLLEPNISKKIDSTSTGARMPRANMNALLDFSISLPPIEKQQIIVSKLKDAFEEILTIKNTLDLCNQNYASLKSAILHQEIQSKEIV